MPKTRKINVILVAVGSLLLDLHYGPYSRLWWQNSKENISSYFPIRVGQTTKTTLNERVFYITILVGNYENSLAPGFICTSGTTSSKIETNPSAAVSNVYNSIFKNATRYSGPLIIGWNDENIISQLSQDVPFFPFSFLVGQVQVFVYGIGVSSYNEWNNAGSGYKASLNYKYCDKPALFVSTIEGDQCILEIHQNSQIQQRFVGNSPNDVWKTSGFLKKFEGIQLFGLENSLTKKSISKNGIPKCSPSNWMDYSLLKPLYDYNLRRRTLADVQWYQFFKAWSQEANPIIEFTSSLKKLYPNNHEFSTRELGAWNAMLHAAGCENVTPWSHDESKVMLIIL